MPSAFLITASYDKQVRIWDAATGRTMSTFVFQDSQVNAMLLLPGTRTLAVAGFGVIRLFDLAQRLQVGLMSSNANTPGTAAAPTTIGGGGMAGGGAGGAAQAPALVGSFESQSSMNFTSLGAFPLVNAGSPRLSTRKGLDAFSGWPNSASGSFMDQPSMADVLNMTTVLGEPQNLCDVRHVLYATSEDGHVRFFDANSHAHTTLLMLKDIGTGAAITCSAISPDRRFLITGNQIGQVSVWHLPSIIASVSIERERMRKLQQQQTPKNQSNPGVLQEGDTSKNQHADPNSTEASPRAQSLETKTAEEVAAAEKIRREAALFGSQPLQEMAFADDYTAVRSIDIDPLGRWVVVATNGGKLHFLRFARDAKLGGSKAPRADVLAGEVVEKDDATGAADGLRSASKLGSNAAADNGHNTSTTSVPFGASSQLMTGSVTPPDTRGPRECIYRSALMVNELSNAVKRGGGDGGSGGIGQNLSGVGGASTIGAALLNSLEQQYMTGNSRRESGSSLALSPAKGEAGAADTVSGTGEVSLGRERLEVQDQLELETFHSFQAHYKYILKVAIAPNCELLVTCSADYTVGRYAVPSLLHLRPPTPAGSGVNNEDDATAAAATAVQREPSAFGSQNEVSVASTQAPADQAEAAVAAVTTTSEGPASPLVELIHKEPDAEGEAVEEQKQQQQAKTKIVSAPAEGELATSSQQQQQQQAAAMEKDFFFRALKSLSGHDRWVWDCVLSDCCNYLFTASSDSTVRMWSSLMAEKPQCTSFTGHTKPVVSVLLHYEK